jgi:hypothetical protein
LLYTEFSLAESLVLWQVLNNNVLLQQWLVMCGVQALVACKLYKSMAKEAEQDDFEIEICLKLSDYSK